MPRRRTTESEASQDEEANRTVSFTQFFDTVDAADDNGKPVRPPSAKGGPAESEPSLSGTPLARLLRASITPELGLTAALKACLTCSLCGRFLNGGGGSRHGSKRRDPVVIETCGHCFCYSCIDLGAEYGCAILSRADPPPAGEHDGWPWKELLPGARPATTRTISRTTHVQHSLAGKGYNAPEAAEARVRRPDTQRKEIAGCRMGNSGVTRRRRRPQNTCPVCEGPVFRCTLVSLPMMQALCEALDPAPSCAENSAVAEPCSISLEPEGLVPGLGSYLAELEKAQVAKPGSGSVAESVTDTEEEEKAEEQGEGNKSPPVPTPLPTEGPRAVPCASLSHCPSSSSPPPPQASCGGFTQCSVELFPPPQQQRQQQQQQQAFLMTEAARGRVKTSTREAWATAPVAFLSSRSPTAGEAEGGGEVLSGSATATPNGKSVLLDIASASLKSQQPRVDSPQGSMSEEREPSLRPCQRETTRRQRSDGEASPSLLLGGEASLTLAESESEALCPGSLPTEDREGPIGGSTSLLSQDPATTSRVGTPPPRPPAAAEPALAPGAVVTPSPPQTLLDGVYRDLIYGDSP